MLQFLKRSWNLAKIGRAAVRIRRSTEDETRDRARHYLVELLGQSRGLPAKVGQFLSLNDTSDQLEETLNQSVEPVDFSEIEEILHNAFNGNYHSVFKKVDPKAHAASLGQVHRARLRDGREVAVKVRYPHIKSGVEAELSILGLMPGMGPVKRWGFDWNEYVDTFQANFAKELDYRNEAEQQMQYRKLASRIDGLVIPEVIPEFCRDNVLVQIWEEGGGLDSISQWEQPLKRKSGEILLAHYLTMLFRHGLVHSDPNPGNFAFRLQNGLPQVVLYDYGSLFEIKEKDRLGILRIIQAAQRREGVDPMACLAEIGFDVDKLRDLRPQLPALLALLFEPFLEERPYNVKSWNLKERVEAITGELKWWFRSAAPPQLIFLVRTLNGVVRHLARLDARLSWRWILHEVVYDEIQRARNLPLPMVSEASREFSFQGLAQYLKVQVVKASGRVNLTMPARVVDEFETVIDQAVLESIRKQNINLKEVQRRAQQSGYAPQVLFEVKDEVREVKVWLE